MENTNFEKAYSLNVKDKTESKNGLSYLSWAWAWAEFKKIYKDATFRVIKDENGKPYIYDENLGYMVFTEVTAGGVTHEMWLPVMDGANKSMKASSYTYSTKYGEKTVEQASMFDINKTLMRCLTKNLAMFGLGLYIYAGEDLPEELIDTRLDEIKALGKNAGFTGKTMGEFQEFILEKTSIKLEQNNYDALIKELNKLIKK